MFRGSQARRELQRMKQEIAAAEEIQAAWGRHRQRQRTLAMIVEVTSWAWHAVDLPFLVLHSRISDLGGRGC